MGLKRREATKFVFPTFPPLNMISAFTGPLCDMAGSLKGTESERTTHSLDWGEAGQARQYMATLSGSEDGVRSQTFLHGENSFGQEVSSQSQSQGCPVPSGSSILL